MRWLIRAGFQRRGRRASSHLHDRDDHVLSRPPAGRRGRPASERGGGRALRAVARWRAGAAPPARDHPDRIAGARAISSRTAARRRDRRRIHRRPAARITRHVRGEVPVLVPLPHPSGQSRWLNDPARVGAARSRRSCALREMVDVGRSRRLTLRIPPDFREGFPMLSSAFARFAVTGRKVAPTWYSAS